MPSYFFNIYNNSYDSEFDVARSNVIIIVKQQQNFFRANGYMNKSGRSRQWEIIENSFLQLMFNFSLHMRHSGR